MAKLLSYRLFGGLRRTWATLFSPRYLLVTNTGIGLSLGGGGDFINQNFEIYKGYKKNWLWSRSRNQCIQGMFFGAGYHYWYIFLDKWFPGKGSYVIFKKLVADQVVMAPITVVLYLVILNFLEGKDTNRALDSVKKKAGKLMLAEWTLGPASQLINFYFLPTRFRVLYDSMVCLSFDAYYAYVKYERNDLAEMRIKESDDDEDE